MNTYKQQMNSFSDVRARYTQGLNDTGIVSGEGYTVGPDPSVPYVLKATAGQPGTAPLYLNPSAALYTEGRTNQVLLSSAASQCDTGCLTTVHKPDPRVHQVKPLYQAHIYQAPKGQALPTPYNVVGMY